MKKHSRGRATAFLAFGLVVGDLISFGVLMNITKKMSPELGFMFVAAFVFCLGTLLMKLIKEPQIKIDDKRSISFHRMKLIEKLQTLTSEVIHESRTNVIIPLCYAGVFVIKLVLILFNTFIVLWISSFIKKGEDDNDPTHVLKDQSEAKSIIIKLNVAAFVIGSVLFMPIGKLTDSMPAYKSLPLAFLLRATFLTLLITVV